MTRLHTRIPIISSIPAIATLIGALAFHASPGDAWAQSDNDAVSCETRGATFILSSTDSAETVEFTGSTSAGVTAVVDGADYCTSPTGVINNLEFYGWAGDDTFTNSTTLRVIADGGEGNDTLTGNVGDDVLIGGDGDDLLIGGDGSDRLMGGSGADELRGNTGKDYLLGQDGDDILRGHAGNDELRGGSGDDTLYGNSGLDTLLGDSGDDTLYGGGGDDVLIGGVGEDTLDGGGDTDHMEDTQQYTTWVTDSSDNIVYANQYEFFITSSCTQAGTVGSVDVYECGDTVYLECTSADGCTLSASTETVFFVTVGLKIQSAGATMLLDHPDKVVFQGKDGNDDADFQDLDVPVYAIGAGGDDTLVGGTSGDYLYGEEGDDFIKGQAGSDYLFGGTDDDTLYGGNNADVLYGDDQDDLLYGGGGNDTLYSGYGTDEYLFGDNGNDTFYATSQGSATIFLGGGTASSHTLYCDAGTTQVTGSGWSCQSGSATQTGVDWSTEESYGNSNFAAGYAIAFAGEPTGSGSAYLDGSAEIEATVFSSTVSVAKLSAEADTSSSAQTGVAKFSVLGTVIETWTAPVSSTWQDDYTLVDVSTTISVMGIPVTLSGEVSGSIGMTGSVSLISSGVSFNITPFVDLMAYASASVGIACANAGVGGELNLLDLDIPFTLDLTLDGSDVDWSLTGDLILDTLDGKIYVEVNYCVGSKRKTIIDWDGVHYELELLSESGTM